MKERSNLAILMEYAGSYRYFTYASWGLSALSALLALAPFCYIWLIIREALATAPDFSAARGLVYNGWMALFFAVISLLVYIAGLMCSHVAAFRVAANIRRELMHHIVKLPLGFTGNFGSGRLRKIVNESSAATESYLAHQLPDRAGAIATPIGLLVLLLIFDWRLGALSLVPVLMGFSIMTRMTGGQMRAKMQEYQNALEEMSNEAVEYVRGIPVVKTFGQTVFSFRRFKDSIDRYCKWVTAYTEECRRPMLCYTAAVNSVFVLLVAAGLFFTREGVTEEFLLNLLFYIIVTPVIAVTLTKIMFQSRDAMIVDDSLKRIGNVKAARPLPESTAPAHPRDGSVDVEDASYSYDGQRNAVTDISLRVRAGETAALVGPSGGGKTTLASLIPRFFDPQRGRVLAGDADVREIDKDELMETVSFVFQDSRLIKATILENVRMGNPGASRDEVMGALTAAQCTEIIEKLPRGIDSVVGADGVYLSGGEQQRIAIARVMLKNSPIVVLDEATSFADPDNETRVQEAFSALSKGKSVILIAHRLSTVVNADRIFVIKEGGICESGDFSELKKQGGLFCKMWDDYLTSVKWKVAKEA